jgi:type I site-specific restriction-modification system R (restriction) subunit
MSNDEWCPRRGYQKTPYGYIIDGIEFVLPEHRDAHARSRKTPEQLAAELDYSEHNAEQWRKLMELDNEIGEAVRKRKSHLDAREEGRKRAERDAPEAQRRLKEMGKHLRGVRGK